MVLALPLFLLTGCGGADRGGVEGTVTLNGQSVDGGRIMFIPTATGVNATADITGGRYQLEGPQGPSVGPCHVEIVWYKKTGRQVPNLSDPGNSKEEKVQLIPPEYNADSRIEVEIKPGMNSFNYDLKSAPAQGTR